MWNFLVQGFSLRVRFKVPENYKHPKGISFI